MSIKHDLPIVTLRLFSAYGYYEEYSRLIPYLIIYMLNNKKISLSSPAAVRDFIFIEDVIDAFIQTAEKIDQLKLGSIFNVGTGVDTKVIEVFNILKTITNYTLEPEISGSSRDSDVARIWRADIEKINNNLDWYTKYDIREGLAKTVEWFKNNLRYYREGE